MDPFLDVPSAALDPQQWNRYAYTRNSPTRFTDPSGPFIFEATSAENDKQWFRRYLQQAIGACRASSGRGPTCDAVFAYGEEGVDNGVTVGFASLKGPRATTTAQLANDRSKTLQKVVFDTRSARGEDPAIYVIHEGQHMVANNAFWMAVVAAGSTQEAILAVYEGPLNLSNRENEEKAYLASADGARWLGHRNLEIAGRQILRNGVIVSEAIARLALELTKKNPGQRIGSIPKR